VNKGARKVAMDVQTDMPTDTLTVETDAETYPKETET
jgi:hypothetical protein